MSASTLRQPPPSAQEAAIARQSGQQLARLVGRKRPLTVHVIDGGKDQPIELPAGAVELLMDILETMAAGRGVTIIPENAELTTVQAAAVLNVSRPFLINLIDEGAFPCRLVGKHRRVRLEDVMVYKTRIDEDRGAALDALAADAQANDMGYGTS